MYKKTVANLYKNGKMSTVKKYKFLIGGNPNVS